MMSIYPGFSSVFRGCGAHVIEFIQKSMINELLSNIRLI